MLFQKPKFSRDVQNMMPKIITYRSGPKKKCKSSFSLFDEIICNESFDGKILRSRKFSMTSRIKKTKKESSAKKKIEVEI